ncbi:MULTISPECIES: isocitrate lyase/phosphoenolpyruvate mutase family protein [unclassified Undibacterium]|uniref:isocitrate lyase/phosphoenolpyruvate mutase family protein n=1 Tax=unclassified Undibacterium TaxID=2630295 RepID=UPI002AC9C792|nr:MULTISPECIES: isocitrate lyase/phosphoenolpyruvate mutase family protein [unclassified Undibacterium]MEB0138466.1 isocitrate lyase/phosphoenolpyruvate mutase family protein [Undibacterium sp. CCC2.1]MEB0173134.1 isocitrate lyase/phosphoenolpyruvate mutase family protein [Undibacterium sp. CCC1.1]MEB0177524.1 isocitrate lyase/phosphoenolpyruvate mutase family protein [Undibacterium sp. CCC3.4]MEB0216160.1 isocitrate lyase/phosphoenolpyruvate mutase family protein [Undibacterium sp. 5I2]WPX42
MTAHAQHAAQLQTMWDANPRWQGIERHYTAEQVLARRGALPLIVGAAKDGADKLWQLLTQQRVVHALSAASGHEAVQQVQAGLKVVYCAAPAVPQLVAAITAALTQAQQIPVLEGAGAQDFCVPLVVDAVASDSAQQDVFAQMQALLGAGAAAVQFGDQADRAGGLLPVAEMIARLQAARLAADVLGVPTLLIARTDALLAERQVNGWRPSRTDVDQALTRALAYAASADVIWCASDKPDLANAKAFAAGVHAVFPGKLLAYHCSPTFQWKQQLDDVTIAKFQKELAAMGYQFQFISLAALAPPEGAMFDFAQAYARRQMPAFVEWQELLGKQACELKKVA